MQRSTALIVSSILWVVGVPLAHGVLPWAISLLSPRYGWTEGIPGSWNMLGLGLVLGGAILMVWIMILHLRHTPEHVELSFTPSYVLRNSPYAVTRNPMYTAEVALWLGWALFYGSLVVLAGCGALWTAMNFGAVPREERALEARFGQSYLEYKATVPRWLGRVRR
jgi:protein-S-isoprenylcysteine O-methyltransferase Ste14